MDINRLLRTLIPSFRFFDQPEREPELWARFDDGDWRNVLLPSPPLPLYGLFLNPVWGLHHAIGNQLRQLAEKLLTQEQDPNAWRALQPLIRDYLRLRLKNSTLPSEIKIIWEQQELLRAPFEDTL